MMRFLNRIMQLHDEDEDDDEDEFFNDKERSRSITSNAQNMQFLSSALDINGIQFFIAYSFFFLFIGQFILKQTFQNIIISGINKDSDSRFNSVNINNSGNTNNLNNKQKKRSLNDEEIYKVSKFAKNAEQKNPRQKMKTSKIKAIKNRRSANYVEYKFNDENN